MYGYIRHEAYNRTIIPQASEYPDMSLFHPCLMSRLNKGRHLANLSLGIQTLASNHLQHPPRLMRTL
jgi:hypothetical protein